MATSLFIYGSCVIRDVFEFDTDELFTISRYVARQSFASSFHPVPVKLVSAHEVENNFERRCVSTDLAKSLAGELTDFSYEVLLLDAVESRFDLFAFADGSVCTLTPAFARIVKASGVPYRLIRAGSEEFTRLWIAGWKRFIELAKQAGFTNKIWINKVYHAYTDEKGAAIAFSDRFNTYLDELYAVMAEDIPSARWIGHDPGLFIADRDNKWGYAPFHYLEGYYRSALEQFGAEFGPR